MRSLTRDDALPETGAEPRADDQREVDRIEYR